MWLLLNALMMSAASTSSAQDRADKPPRAGGEPKMAGVKVQIAAQDTPVIPSGSKIRWEGTGEGCTGVAGEQSIRPTEVTPLTLPVCKVKLTIFITGFTTKAVTIDLVGNEKKYADPIQIAVKLQGAAEVSWTHPER